MNIAFIGLGVMGAPMARHLASGFTLSVFDADESKLTTFGNGAVRIAESPGDAAEGADLVMLSLPSSEIVRDVLVGRGDIISRLRPGAAVVDLSTTAPETSRILASQLEEQGIGFLDAPVSGGEAAAQNAGLAIMVGGSQELFDRLSPVLNVLSSSLVRVGDVGAGGVSKLVNNMIVGSTFAVIAEGFSLARQNGLDIEALYQAIRGGWAGSTVLDVAAPGIINNDFQPGGTVNLLFKDLGYALALARSHNVPTPITAQVDEIFKAARASGRGNLAQQIIIKLWEDLGIGAEPEVKGK